MASASGCERAVSVACWRAMRARCILAFGQLVVESVTMMMSLTMSSLKQIKEDRRDPVRVLRFRAEFPHSTSHQLNR